MLGLGASDLAMLSSNLSNFNSSALSHRVRSIQLLKQATSQPPKDKYEADARFATIMVLAQQSAYIPEALTDYFTILRGCVLHGGQVDEEASCFASLLGDNHLEAMEERFNNLQLDYLDRQCLDPATESLAALQPYCMPGIEQEYHMFLSELIRQAYVSPKNGGSSSCQCG